MVRWTAMLLCGLAIAALCLSLVGSVRLEERLQMFVLLDRSVSAAEWLQAQRATMHIIETAARLGDEAHVIVFGEDHELPLEHCNGVREDGVVACAREILLLENADHNSDATTATGRRHGYGYRRENGHKHLGTALRQLSMRQAEHVADGMAVILTNGHGIDQEDMEMASTMHGKKHFSVVTAIAGVCGSYERSLLSSWKIEGVPCVYLQEDYQQLVTEVLHSARVYDGCMEVSFRTKLASASVNEDLPLFVEVANFCTFSIVGHTIEAESVARMDDVQHYRRARSRIPYLAPDETWSGSLELVRREKGTSYRTIPSSILLTLKAPDGSVKLQQKESLSSQLYKKDLASILRKLDVAGEIVTPLVAVLGPIGSGKSTLINHLMAATSNRNSVVEVAKPCGGESHCTVEVKTFAHQLEPEAVIKYRDTYGMTSDHTLLEHGLLEGSVADKSAVDGQNILSNLKLVASEEEREHCKAHAVIFVLPQTLRQFIGAAEESTRLEKYRKTIKSIKNHAVIGVISMWQDVPESERAELLSEFSKEFDIPISDILPFGIDVNARDVRKSETDFQVLDILYKAVGSSLAYINYMHSSEVSPDFLDALDTF